MSTHDLAANAVAILPRVREGAASLRPPLARRALAALTASTLLEAWALVWLGLHRGSAAHAIAAGLIHLAAVAPMILWAGEGRSQRILSGALTFTLPMI